MPHIYQLHDENQVVTPALIFYPELIRANIAAVVKHAGNPARLRPHVKTHKTREIVRMQLEAGVSGHKCATIAEAEMLAGVGVKDILIAYPLVGPNLTRLTALVRKFPAVDFSVTIDQPVAAMGLSDAASRAGRSIGFMLDLDVGQHRTGIRPGPTAIALYEQAARLPNLTPQGLHAYDGHNHQETREERDAAARSGLKPVLEMRDFLVDRGASVPRIVVGGTPTFPIYAAMTDIPSLELSPGTYVLHDYGYGSRFTDLPGITPAAILLTRVVSRPTAERVTFDLGYKAIAADPPIARRMKILDLPEYTVVGHNEEHLIAETPFAYRFAPGDQAYVIPGHVCPTVALHREALIAQDQRITGSWQVAARDRVLTI